jgi:hypothetical protein
MEMQDQDDEDGDAAQGVDAVVAVLRGRERRGLCRGPI